MARAKRHYIPGHVWHITHRCHKREFLLKFPIDFDRLMDMLGFENYDDLKDAHYKWVDSAMQTEISGRENKWTQSIAVGSN